MRTQTTPRILPVCLHRYAIPFVLPLSIIIIALVESSLQHSPYTDYSQDGRTKIHSNKHIAEHHHQTYNTASVWRESNPSRLHCALSLVPLALPLHQSAFIDNGKNVARMESYRQKIGMLQGNCMMRSWQLG